MGLSDIGFVALVDKVFLIGYVVVKAGFGQAEAAGNVGQCRGTGTLGVE